MKKLMFISTIFTITTIGCQNPETVANSKETIVHDGIKWEGNSKIANHLAKEGLNRYITYENNHAFIFSESAVDLDSSLFASHVLLGFLSEGSRKDYHKRMANKFVDDKNEVNKLFVSLLDFDNVNDSLRINRRKIWSKMHELSNSHFIHYMYTRFMEGDNAARIKELDKLIKFCEENNFNYTGAAANNYKGYLLKYDGDLAAGTLAIEKTVELHPKGYNPYDSRAEFYLYAGDTINSIKWYKKALEQYPYAQYASNSLEKLKMTK